MHYSPFYLHWWQVTPFIESYILPPARNIILFSFPRLFRCPFLSSNMKSSKANPSGNSWNSVSSGRNCASKWDIFIELTPPSEVSCLEFVCNLVLRLGRTLCGGDCIFRFFGVLGVGEISYMNNEKATIFENNKNSKIMLLGYRETIIYLVDFFYSENQA